MDRSGPGFEVLDGELVGGTGAVERVDVDDVVGLVGEERVVTPGVEQLRLLAQDPGAAHDQSAPL